MQWPSSAKILTGDPLEALRATRTHVSSATLLALRAAADVPAIRAALLERLRQGPPSQVPAAIEALTDQAGDPEVRAAFLGALTDPAEAVRAAALRTLPQVFPAEAATAELREKLEPFLDDPSAQCRLAALELLAPFSSQSPELLDSLATLLQDRSSRVRRAAILVLAPQLSSDQLHPLVGDRSPRVACTAAACLVRDQSWQGIQFWEKALADPDPERRKAAAALLPAELVAAKGKARAQYLRVLAEEDPELRAAALAAAAPLVASDAEIRAAVLASLGDHELPVRLAAIKALRGAARQNLRELARVLRGDEMPARLAALEVLLETARRFGRPGAREGGAQTLIGSQLPAALRIDVDDPRRLADKNQVTRVRAGLAQFLAPRLQRDFPLVDLLLGQLQTFNSAARIGAAYVLASWRSRPEEVDDLLLAYLADERDDSSLPRRLTGAAQIVVGRLPQLAEARDVLLGALDYGLRPWDELVVAPNVRRLAARILGALPAYDEYVFSRLLQVLHRDADPEVRGSASQAVVALARRHMAENKSLPPSTP